MKKLIKAAGLIVVGCGIGFDRGVKTATDKNLWQHSKEAWSKR